MKIFKGYQERVFIIVTIIAIIVEFILYVTVSMYTW